MRVTRDDPDGESVPGSGPGAGRTGPLIDFLLRNDLLRGPFLYADYWASVLGLAGGIPEHHVEEGWVDPALFRAALDRPDLELPRLRYYLLLFLLGPVLLPLRVFRRLGRYRFRYRRDVGSAVDEALAPHRLALEEAGPGRVRVRAGDTELADGVLDPRVVGGFCSHFYAAYKLPLASLVAIVVVGVLFPAVAGATSVDLVLRAWVPVGYPVLVLALYLVFRDWATAVLGALPVIAGRYLVAAPYPGDGPAWLPFVIAAGVLLLLYLLAEWLFVPRPVPPALFLYVADGPGRPYEREEDAPWWLEGEAYWVWRYTMLTPGEVNKFWERDWERVDLWIRADGPSPGGLEWIVTDAHYRELWMPAVRLAEDERLDRHGATARRYAAEGRPGIWLAEVDAHLLFHTPYVRTVSFLAAGEDVPVRSLTHLLSGLFRRAERDRAESYLDALDRLRLSRGAGILDDIPEAALPAATRHLLGQPWRYWRYPLGAHRRRDHRLYERPHDGAPPPAADPSLQVKTGPGRGG